MVTAFQPAADEPARRLWQDVLRPMAHELQASAPGLSGAVASAIRDDFPDLFVSEDSFEEIRAATEGNLSLAARMMEEGLAPEPTELPDAAAAYSYEAVHRGVPLAALHRTIRLGHADVWRWSETWIRRNVADQDDLLAALELASAWMFAIVDAISIAVEAAYAEERERWIRTAASVRAETIATILAGGEIDSGTASARLRHDLERHHAAMIAWVETAADGRDTLSMLESAIDELARATDAVLTLSQPSGLLAVEAWISYPSAPDLRRLDETRIDPLSAQGVRIAIGEPCFGITGFRLTHDQATHARRVASLSQRPAGTITRYGRVALQAMVSTDLDQARAFVRRELAGLVADDDTSMKLAATLQIYLEENGSRIRAAKRLGVHENTVSYRVKQALDILGCDLDDDTLGLRVALAIAPTVRGQRRDAVTQTGPGSTQPAHPDGPDSAPPVSGDQRTRGASRSRRSGPR